TKNDATPLLVLGGAVALLLAAFYVPLNSLISFVKKQELSKSGFTKKIYERLGVLIRGYKTIRKHPNLLPRMVGWMLVSILSSGIIYFLIYQALGVQISTLEALFISVLTY